jgi:hypothetical protein
MPWEKKSLRDYESTSTKFAKTSIGPSAEEVLLPKLSDSVDSHRVPMGSAVRMGRRNFFAGSLNGSRAAQIVPESPGGQRPTTETSDAAGEEVLETPGALTKPGCLLRRPMRTAEPIGPFCKNQH